MKKKKNNKVVFLLDETGSMESIKSDAIGGFNNFLTKQKKNKKIKFTLTLFNSDKIEKRYVNVPIEEVENLTNDNYNPSFMTPLWDAIGYTIKELKNKKNILFIILTDGYENHSVEYKNDTIKNLIKEKEKKFNWKFLFLGAGLDNFNDAEIMGIKQHENFARDHLQGMYSKLSDTVNKFYKTGKVELKN